MTTAQLPLGLAQPHHNQQLFADHYLNVVLPNRPEWQALRAEAAHAQADIRAIFATFTPSAIEAQTEDELIKPILARLGHTVEVQAALRSPRGTKKPDYVFYQDAAARASNKDVTLTEEVLASKAYAIGDAKYWNRPLDVSLKLKTSDPDINKVPADQIAFYMLHSGVTWGILTNGRLWRLYHKDTAQKQDRFYEVDLELLTLHGTPEDFRYFYAFFRRPAFADQPLSAAAMLSASVEAARAIGDNLRQQVYLALRHLAQGFLDYRANALTNDPATLKQIYDNSLTVLYRLLFILYAEARELLPLRTNPDYRTEHSLASVARDVANRLDSGKLLLPTGSALWARLRDLCDIINDGSPPLSVATFNGGLFDPQRHPFLARNTVGDAQLASAIELLSRTNGAFIDYRDLAERHLGTLYEGLLEQHLAPIAPTAQWTIDLFDSAGERHRTGSYYTPDFVVQYIVSQTVGPALERATAGKTTDEERLAAVLEVNICDPAMGSGHFLVAAMEYIARYLVDLGVSPGDEAQGEADLAFWKRRVAQSCIYGVDLNPLAVDLAKLSLWLATAASDRPLSFLDHHLRCGNALVGARLADLGQRTPTTNSTTKRAQQQAAQIAAAGQVSMLDDDAFQRSMRLAVGSLWQIEASPARTVADVKQQETSYLELRDSLARQYLKQADLVAAARLGVTVEPALWPSLNDYVTGRSMAALPKVIELAEQARALIAQHRPFHWELEFPEVFFDRHGQALGAQAGFDAVIGNPPYVRQELLAPLKPYLQAGYPETYHGAADLYVYFYQRGVELLQPGGRMSYIVTNKWMRAGYGEPLRSFFAEHAIIHEIIDFGHAPIFAEADVFPCIIVLERPAAAAIETPANVASDQPSQVQVTIFPREALGTTTLERYVENHHQRVPQRRFGRNAWSLEANDVDELMEKLRRVGVPLAEFAGVRPYRGPVTGFNEAFLIDTPTKERLVREDPRSAEIIKPYLRGQDMERWSSEWKDLWMIFTGVISDISHYPAIERHLNQFRAALDRRAGAQLWWQTQSRATYHEMFSRPKISYPDITWRSQFSLDTEGRYSNNTVYFLPIDSSWLLAVLNSPLLWSFYWRKAVHGKDEALRFFSDFVETIPIAPPTDAQRAEVEPAVLRLIAITKADQQARRDTLDWLHTEFEIATPGQKLEVFSTLDEASFIEEVRKRRPKSLGKLTPAGLRALRDGYSEQARPIQERSREALGLERRLAAIVNEAYGLTPEEVDLLWRTAPPRMPVGRG